MTDLFEILRDIHLEMEAKQPISPFQKKCEVEGSQIILAMVKRTKEVSCSGHKSWKMTLRAVVLLLEVKRAFVPFSESLDGLWQTAGQRRKSWSANTLMLRPPRESSGFDSIGQNAS